MKLPVLLASVLACGLKAQIPAPNLEWGPWRPLINCGGAEYSISFSQDDGRNEFQVQLRAFNRKSTLISTRFEATLSSETGNQMKRSGGSRINAGSAPAQNGSFSLGVIFPAPVNQPLPVRISRVLLDIDTADLSKPPPYAGPAVYLGDFTDYPVTQCHGIPAGSPERGRPEFVGLTETCYNQLPHWTQACNKAVDALIGAYNSAQEPAKSCILQWRQFQKCYESYAYSSSPVPAPHCQNVYPTCQLK